MLEQLKSTLNIFDHIVGEAYQNYEHEKQEIVNETKWTAKAKEEATQEALKKFEKIKDRELRDAFKSVNSQFDDAYKKLNEIVAERPPEEVSQTIQAISICGKYITDFEAENIIESYKDNYICCKAVTSIFHSNDICKNKTLLGADYVKNELDGLKDGITTFLYGYGTGKNNNLSAASYLSEEINPINGTIAKIQPFFNHDFVVRSNLDDRLDNQR
ncbi:MAG: hypothetical protein LUG60_12975 [Erysipelotrichaceae bacterium]|nr:hypothetical protein [Erysipelotrichaceae bacterium]